MLDSYGDSDESYGDESSEEQVEPVIIGMTKVQISQFPKFKY